MAELILHIGMGKTGTTSIQTALRRNPENLTRQKAEYLGMWFTAIDPSFEGLSGQKLFFRSTPEEMTIHAERFGSFLMERAAHSGVETFILSNEILYLKAKRILPFVTRLQQILPVRLIAYVRDPADWLPSAYNQWMIYHKKNAGPIMEFSEGGRLLISNYRCICRWARTYPNQFTLRSFDKAVNILDDFSQTIGFNLDIHQERQQERPEISESILRAIYNNRLKGEALPHLFNEAIGPLNLSAAPSLEHLVATCFSYDATETILAEQAALFEDINALCGINLLKSGNPAINPPDLQTLRNRALEQILLLTLDQADRIKTLEGQIKALQEQMNSKE